MHRKHFGCGSSLHTKKNGYYDCDLCRYYKRTDYQKVICMEKFLQQAKKQKAAATVEEKDSLKTKPSNQEPEEGEQATIATITAATLVKLKEQQKILSEKIAVLKTDF